jgi:hemoglobin
MSSAPADAPAGTTEISGRAQLLPLLEDFYTRAFADPLLGPVFVEIAGMDLDAHLPVIADFWETVLFRTGRYRRNALRPHQRLHVRAGLTTAHFERWLALWVTTIDDRHHGPKAELAKRQGTRMAYAMCHSITGEDALALRRRLAG